MQGRNFAAALIVALGAACSPAMMHAMSAGLSSAGDAAALAAGAGTKLMIFGGESNDVYLGCLNCSEYALDSVLNRYGPHGSPYMTESVLNPYSPYGSKYSSTGACNPYASEPPVIVDENGNFYGRLTMNRHHPQAANAEVLVSWLESVCK